MSKFGVTAGVLAGAGAATGAFFGIRDLVTESHSEQEERLREAAEEKRLAPLTRHLDNYSPEYDSEEAESLMRTASESGVSLAEAAAVHNDVHDLWNQRWCVDRERVIELGVQNGLSGAKMVGLTGQAVAAAGPPGAFTGTCDESLAILESMLADRGSLGRTTR